MTTGEKLYRLRIRTGFSQAGLVGELNSKHRRLLNHPLTRDRYANYETDRDAFPWDVAKALVKYYQITLDELILEDKKPAVLQGGRRLIKIANPVR